MSTDEINAAILTKGLGATKYYKLTINLGLKEY